MRKKFVAVVITAAMVVASMAACGKKTEKILENQASVETENKQEQAEKLKVVTTIFPPYDFAKNIGGDRIELSSLVKLGAEIHSYEPTPSDIKSVSDADLFIYTGGENDVWVEDILSSMDRGPVKTLRMVDSVDTLNEVIVEGMEHSHDHEGHDHEEHRDHDHEDHDHEEHKDHDHEGHDHEEHKDHDHEGHDHEEHRDHDHEGHDHEEHKDHDHEGHDHEEHKDHDHDEHIHEDVIDEHIWTSPKNAIRISEKIKDLMKELDPENAEFFEENFKAYSMELESLDKELTDVVSNSENKTIVVADRFPFLYLAKHYGIDYYAAFSGCSTDTEAKPSTITFLINKVKDEGIQTVFKIEMSDGKLADAVCEATGAKTEVLHSAHNLSKEEIEEGVSYLGLMKKNIELLKKALDY